MTKDYKLSADGKGLLRFFKDGSFYHIHSDELTANETKVRNGLIYEKTR